MNNAFSVAENPTASWHEMNSYFVNRKSILLILLFLINLFLLNSQSAIDQQALAKKADALLQYSVNAKDFVGVAAGVAADGAIRWQGGAGYRDLANAVPADEHMLHRLASITKPMTAVAILQLVDAGKLELDVPIQTYLPDFPKKKQGDITIRQLLTHTSGVGAYKSSKEFKTLVHYPTMAAATEFFRKRKLLFAPGTAYQYTTYGYTILGAIIEAVTGTSYAAYMREHVWGPAGMTATDIEEHGEAYPNKAQLYRRAAAGNWEINDFDDLSIKYPGGGTHSTVGDLLRFGQAILNHKLVTAEQLELMYSTPDVPRRGTPYGMGWYVMQHEKYGRIIRHGGAQNGTSTYLAIYLDHNAVVAVLANTENVSMEVGNLKGYLKRYVLEPETLAEPFPHIAQLNAADLARLTGKYSFPDGQVLKISERGGDLWATQKGYGSVRVFPGSDRNIFYRGIDISIDLELDEAGQVQQVTHTMFGKSQPLEKF